MLALAPLLLAAALPQGGGTTTPGDFLVRVHDLELSEDGVLWLPTGAPSSSRLVDLVGEPVHDVGEGEAPVGVYERARVAIGALMQFEGIDPCSGQSVIETVDWSGDEVVDPDGDGRWQVHFATAAAGGTSGGNGSALAPLLLDAPIAVIEGQTVTLRMVLGVKGILECVDGMTTVQRPRAHLSNSPGTVTASLAGSVWQFTGARMSFAEGTPTFTTFKAEATLHGDGRWSTPLIHWRDLTIESGANDFGTEPWEGWWSVTPGGELWLTRSRFHAPLTGWVREDGDALSVASAGAGGDAYVLWGLRKGSPAPQHPFTSPHRVVVHDVDVHVRESDPLVADLSVWRIFGRFIGDVGMAQFDASVQRNRLRCEDWIGEGTPGPPLIDVDWLALNQGIAYSVQQGASAFGLTFLDLSSYYDGWLSPSGDVGLFDRRDLPAFRMGLGVTVRLPSGLNNSSLQGRSFQGAFFEDELQRFSHRYRTGRMSVHFTSGSACLVTMTHTGPRVVKETSVPGTFECWGEGRVIITLSDGRRYEGQVCPSRRTLSITSSELGVDGFEDRLIGFLVKP